MRLLSLPGAAEALAVSSDASQLAVAFSSLEGNTWEGGVAVLAVPTAGPAGSDKPAPVSTWIRVDSGVTSTKWFDPATLVVSCDSGDVKVGAPGVLALARRHF